MTIVSRLHAKGLLARQRAGRGFTYTPVDEASLAASRMSQVLGSEHDHDAVLSRFVSGLSSRDARLLRELLAGDTGPAGGDPGRGRGTGVGHMWLLYLPLVIPALAGAAARPLAARLEPRHATWLLTTAAVALAACSMAALALLAAYAAARLPFLAAAGDYSPAVMRRGDPISAAAGVAAALALTGARRGGRGHVPQPGPGPGRVVPARRRAARRGRHRRGARPGHRGVRPARPARPHRGLGPPARLPG